MREQLLEERQKYREEVRAQRQRMAAEQRRAIAELEKKRECDRKARRSASINAGRRSTQLRDELQQVHRETLEVRLATEELWAQLSGAAPPAALTRSLGRIRTQLADQYRLANAELLERKKELESIRDQLAGQYEKLVEQRRQFEHWAAGRRQEAEQQAARLDRPGAGIGRRRDAVSTNNRGNGKSTGANTSRKSAACGCNLRRAKHRRKWREVGEIRDQGLEISGFNQMTSRNLLRRNR